MTFEATQAHAEALDGRDRLANFRERFFLPPGRGRSTAIYFCGNSLGLQPKGVRELIDEELEDWARFAVLGHLEARRPWLPYHEQLTNDTALLVGARPGEVVNMNTLTVNLHLMMVSFYRPTRERHCILIEKGAFPSDRYAVVSHLGHHGYSAEQALIEVAPRAGDDCVRHEDIEALLAREGSRVALVMLPGVQYRTGQSFDIARVTRGAHAAGARVGFDLAHAVGNVELRLHEWGADFACWCTYKYLNAGPGSIGGCFVHGRHAQSPELPRFAGWWGHDKARRFLMQPDFEVLAGAEGWQISNPPILSMAPLVVSLAMFREAGMAHVVEKSQSLTGFLEFLVRTRLPEQVEIVTPSARAERGCQLSLRLRSGAQTGKRVFAALEQRDVVVDWREPDIIRVAPVPLYNTFTEVWEFVDTLATSLKG
ncbi:MAG TPA: kynureninase [Steroidobacteraceae bacterium]|nr:kynureninase [Steroidobacteraceae bacterium]